MSAPNGATCHARVEVVRGVSGKSVLRTAYAESPLALTAPRNFGTAAWVYPSVLGPGMLGGDTHALDLEVGDDATCYVGSVGIARAFAGATRLELRARVAAGGLLVFAPEPLTGAEDAELVQDAQFSLASGASLVVVDAITQGRPATGERWRFARLRTRLRVSCADREVLEEAQDLAPRRRDVAAHFGEYGAFAFAFLTGPRVGTLRESWLRAEPSGRGELLRVTAPLGDGSATLRMATRSAEALAEQMPFVLGNLQETLGDDPRSRRTW